MLFAHAFDKPNLLSRIRHFRKSRVRVYGSAFGLVAVATLARLVLHQELSTNAPFTTYSLAVLCIALAGGFWPGVVTLAFSLVVGSILFLPPAFSFALADGAGWTMLMFGLFGSINIVLVSGMTASILLHDDHQQFLFGELRHRSRNLFAVVQGIVSRTLVETQTLSEARLAIEMRLSALARTHAMLADNGWTGAPLSQIVSEELMSFTNQVSCVGCDLVLNTPAAQTFSLIIHELTTNAVKHGALSRPEGQVSIEGRIEEAEGNNLFRFAWTEAGGPVVERSERKGFGSSILTGMARRFGQSVETTYRPEGLIYELQVSVNSIQSKPTPGSIPDAVKPASAQTAQLTEGHNERRPRLSIMRPGLSL
jgi:two-component sensor histidine kinase